MNDLIYQIAEYQSANVPFTLCILTNTSGSTPRKAGAKMIVFGDGKVTGTIGGGAIELQVIADAKLVLESGKPLSRKYQLEKDLSMQCGGNCEVYFEAFNIQPDLFIFGAGHVGREVGRYASTLGFKVHFIDFRKELLDNLPCENPVIIHKNFLEATESLIFNTRSYVVITTPSHESDEALLNCLAKKNLAYIGLIASERKVAKFRKNALEKETLTEEEFNKVNMPIGFPFKVETPAEIAISIVAKLIDVKNRQ